MRRLSRDECFAFLRSPVRPAMLATTRADGRPHVVPVWFALDDDGTIVFNTGANTVKGRSVRRDGRVALCVQDERPPYSFVTVQGHATWSDELDEVKAWATRIGGRYLGESMAETMGERNGVPGELLVRVTPDRLLGEVDLAD